jgi:hypothetical protein
MADKATKTLAVKTQGTTVEEPKRRFDMAIVDGYVVKVKSEMERFNKAMKPARDSYIAFALLIQEAKSKLVSAKPKGGAKSEWTVFMEAVNIDKFYVSRMLRIAAAAPVFKEYEAKLPNTENSLYFIAGLLEEDKPKAMKLLKSPNLVPQVSARQLKKWAAGESGNEQSMPQSYTIVLGDFDDSEYKEKLAKFLRLVQKHKLEGKMKLTVNLKGKSEEERAAFIEAANKIGFQTTDAEEGVFSGKKLVDVVTAANNAISGAVHTVPTTG